MIEHEFGRPRMMSTDIADVTTALHTAGSADDRPSEMVDQIRTLEELKGAAAAAQARVTAIFAATQRSAQRAAGVRRPARWARGSPPRSPLRAATALTAVGSTWVLQWH